MKGILRKMMLGLVVCFIAFTVILASGRAMAAPQPTIKIGIIGPMRLMQGEQMWAAAEIAADDINNVLGGINVGGVKHKIELIKANSNSQASIPDAVSAFEKLVTLDKVNFVMGGWRSEAALAQEEVMAKHKILFFGVGCSHPEMAMRVGEDYEKYKYFFRPAAASGAIFIVPMVLPLVELAAREIREKLGFKKPTAAVLADKAIYTDPLIEAVQDFAPKIDVELVGVWRNAMRATDLTSELTAIKSAGAQIIVTMFATTAGSVFSKQWGELKIPAITAGFNIEAQRLQHWKDTNGLCNYLTTSDTIARVEMTKKTIPYWDKFLSKTGEQPTIYSVGMNDSFYVLKDAIERTGTLDTQALIGALEKLDYISPVGRLILYPPGHKYAHDLQGGPGLVTPVGVQWVDGNRVVVWPDGRPTMGDERWKKIKYKGTEDYTLPPWVIKYWKEKK